MDGFHLLLQDYPTKRLLFCILRCDIALTVLEENVFAACGQIFILQIWYAIIIAEGYVLPQLVAITTQLKRLHYTEMPFKYNS